MGIKKIRFCIFLIILILLFSFSVDASIKVEPSRFIFMSEPGGRITDVIQVTNDTGERIELIAEFYDWDLNDNYEMVNYQSGTLKESLDGLIRFNPRNISLEPGETQIVRFTIAMPEDDEISFERRGIIFFEHETRFDSQETGAAVRSMIGSNIYLLPLTYELNFSLSGIVQEVEDSEYWVILYLENSSLVHIRHRISYILVNDQGRQIEEGELKEKILLPENNRFLYFPLETDLQPGNYEVLLTVNYIGTGEQMTTSIPFAIE